MLSISPLRVLTLKKMRSLDLLVGADLVSIKMSVFLAPTPARFQQGSDQANFVNPDHFQTTLPTNVETLMLEPSSFATVN